jgi:acetate kinase
MGTRSGDVDPGVVFHLMRALGMDADRIDALLNRESGLLGLSGVSNDLRDVRRAAQSGNRRADLALDLFCYRLKKYIGAYTAVLGRVDALVFTAGIGENGPGIRERSCAGLEALGYRLDPTKNVAKASGLRDIAARDSEKRIFVIPTDEEAMIARDTARIAAEE